MTIKELTDYLEKIAPLSYQEDYDNCGLIVGDANAEITNVLVSLDVTLEVIEEAISKKCNLIIAHHLAVRRLLPSYVRIAACSRRKQIAKIRNMDKAGYQIRDHSKPHFMTFTVVDWVDIFTRKIYRDILIDSLKFCQKQKGLILHGYVIMTNHIHVIFQTETGNLSDLVRDFKVFTAKEILKTIENGPESRSDWMLKRFEFAAKSQSRNSKYQFWEYGNHPEEIFSEKFFWTKLNYIHMNPVRSGIVTKASDYVYSSASNYARNEGIIDVCIASVPIIDFTKQNSIIEINDW